MPRKRVYEIAREGELPVETVLQRLRDAGLDVSHHANTVDADEARAALGPHLTPGNGKPGSSGGNGSGVETGGEPEPTNFIDRLRLKHRLSRLKDEQDAQLADVGGLAVELRRVGGEREDLAAAVDEAVRRDAEILRLEKLLDPGRVGGTCPSCGLHSARTRYCLRCGHALPGTRSLPGRMSLPLAGLAVVLVALAWLLGGLGNGDSPDQRSNVSAPAGKPRSGAPATAPSGAPVDSVVAAVRGPSIGISRRPGLGPYMTLDSPNLDGARLVFLVRRIQGSWAHVYLPSRPNGSMGWIPLARVSLTKHSYRVWVDLSNRRLVAWNGSRVVARTRIGVGKSLTPTPPGVYYITSLLKQPDPTGIYGPYAMGLSAHSDVLFEFAGRDGILGIHGTNEPEAIGTNVSHGCIRVSNDVITRLARLLPAGTPVRITRVVRTPPRYQGKPQPLSYT